MDPGTCRVVVTGPIAAHVLADLRLRFELERSGPTGEDTVLVVRHVDQAAQRALLTYLWNAGHTVRSVASR